MSQATTTEASTQRPNEFNLVWIDMEMTGLDPDNDRIIEVAAVVADANLNVLAEGPVIAVHQSDETLDKMDAWNKGTHGRSGLIDRVKASTIDEAQAEEQLIAFLKQWVPANAGGTSPRCCATWRICRLLSQNLASSDSSSAAAKARLRMLGLTEGRKLIREV